jgi:lambda family phage portal protein
MKNLRKLKNPKQSLFQKVMSYGFGWSTNSPYESSNVSPNRASPPPGMPTDAKVELTSYTRRELVRRSRYIHKNSGFSREVVGGMAMYSTGDGIKPQAQTDDQEWNAAAEEYFKTWAARCEITNRFSFEECQGLVCRGIDVDGEYFVLRVRDRFGRARIQLIESHRVGDYWDAEGNVVDGIEFGEFGEPVSYRVKTDEKNFRVVPARAVMHILEPESVSAARNAPTMQHSINNLLDEMDLLALEKQAVKDNAGISRTITSENGTLEEDQDFRAHANSDGEIYLPSDPKKVQQIIGGRVVGLKPGEEISSYESQRPSPTFTGFLEHLKRDSSGGGLPHEFTTDSSKVGGAGVRLIVAKADRRFSWRQKVLIQRFLLPTWGWVIGDAIDRGELAPVKNWNKVNWVTPRRITVDAGREAQQNRADVEAGLKTLEDHYAEQGMDFAEELEIRARNARAILDAAEKYDVPMAMLWKPGGVTLTDPNQALD